VSLLRRWFPTAEARPYELGHDGLMHALEGRRGRGKSYALARLMLLMAREKVPMVTNAASIDYYRMGLWLARHGHFPGLYEALVWLEANVTVARTWDDILGAFDSVVIFDEATRLFDARRSLGVQAPAVLFEWFKQSRKVRCTTYFVAHAIPWLDIRIQQNLDVVWLVRKEAVKGRKAPDGTPLPARFHLYGLNPGGVGKVEHMLRTVADLRCSYPFRVEVARMFHSWELVQEISGTPSWGDMEGIKRHHLEAGRHLGIDGYDALVGHVERMRAAAQAQSPARGAARRGWGRSDLVWG
jgi:hypothetical protein